MQNTFGHTKTALRQNTYISSIVDNDTLSYEINFAILNKNIIDAKNIDIPSKVNKQIRILKRNVQEINAKLGVNGC